MELRLKNNLEATLIEGLLTALAEAPDATATVERREAGFGASTIDAIIAAEIGGKPILLLVEAKRSAFPRDVKAAAWQLRNYVTHFPTHDRQVVPMFIAEAISPGARSLLRSERIGYYDTGGSLYIPARGAFLFVDKPVPRRGTRKLNSVFTGRRAQVLHAVWAKGAEWFGVHEIARLAVVSPGTASETLTALERLDWVATRGSGPRKERRLVDTRGFLDAWAEHQKSTRPPLLRRFYVPAPTTGEIIERLDQASNKHAATYAITGEAAAQAYSPYLSTVSQLRCRLLSSPAGEGVKEMLDARSVGEGWNLAVIDSKTAGEFAFRERMAGAWFASPLQTYLDLLQAGGRSGEMADHLRRERLSV